MMWLTLIGGLATAVIGVVGGLLSLVPGVPSWVSDADSGWAAVATAMGGVGGWLPIGLLVDVGGAVVSAYVTAGLIGMGRSGVSHVTGGGGAS